MNAEQKAAEYLHEQVLATNEPLNGVDRFRIREAYQAGYNADRWISVFERLPNNANAVLACFQFGIGIGRHFNNIILDEQCAYTATHWQPLPTP